MSRLGFFAAVLACAAAFAAPPPFELAEVEALLFDRQTGALTPLPTGRLFNRAGDLAIRVKVTGPDEVEAPKRKLSVQVKQGKKTLVDQAQELETVPGGTVYRLFLAPAPGGMLCEPVLVTVKILGQPKATARTQSLQFDCGE
jgi:hypothetical protein